MTIHLATVDDIPAINALFWELDTTAIELQPEHFQRGERSDEYLTEIITGEKSCFLLAELVGKVIGFSLLYERSLGGLNLLIPCKYAYIQDFIVTEKHRNQGIGSLLMDASKEWGKSRGAEYMRLSVMPGNTSARRFYARHDLREQMISMECPI